VKSSHDQVRQLLNDAGVISYNCAPKLIGSIRRMVRNGELSALLPGVFTATSQCTDFNLRMRAVRLRVSDAVFTGLTAAHLLWATEAPSLLTATGRIRGDRDWVALSRRRVDPDWVVHVGGFACTAPELTAIDLIPDVGADYVDLLVRKAGGHGAETLARMWEAHDAHHDRPGNRLRQAVLAESRQLPWSEAERLAHRQLREAGIRGWVTNHRVVINKRSYYLDVAFPAVRLDLEIDGFEHHKSRESFEGDRRRQNDLASAGWTVLRVTWTMLQSTEWLIWLEPWRRAMMAFDDSA
jgi:very-short-patch-repair endonuclease